MVSERLEDRDGSISDASPQAAVNPRRKQIVALLVFAVFAFLVYQNFQFVVVDGTSMLPTFKNGQRLTASSAYWLFGKLKDGDIVVFKDDFKDSKTGYTIKRVYKMAGEYVDAGNVPRDFHYTDSETRYKVPDGTVYVLGDNRQNSEDSRYIGPVPLYKVLWKVIKS